MEPYEKTCFVVMPFGKKDADGKTIDFDAIYDRVFLPAINQVDLEPRRTDRDFFAGDITVEMFRYLEYSRFVLADITSLNPNVLYELGVRHRARQSGTAIFRQPDVKLPFDISHIKAFPYEYEPEHRAEQSRALIARVLRESIAEDRTDNIIHLAIAQREQRPRPEVEELRKAAENALRHGDPAAAIGLLRQACRADPRDVLAAVKLGIILKENGGDWAEAAQWFERAAGASEGYSDAWRELGIAQGKLGRPAEGEASLRKAIELNPGDFDAMSSLGGILKRKGDLAAAAAMYRNAVRVSNGHSYPLLNAIALEAHVRGALDISEDQIFLGRAERSLRMQVAGESPYNAPWSFFDLAQIRLFLGDQAGFLDYLSQGVSYAGSSFMPSTFAETLDLLPRDPAMMPALEKGIERLRKAERQLKAAASN